MEKIYISIEYYGFKSIEIIMHLNFIVKLYAKEVRKNQVHHLRRFFMLFKIIYHSFSTSSYKLLFTYLKGIVSLDYFP